MDTEEKLGIKKSKAILLFIQMILVIILLIASIYLLYFVIANNLGPWMITSYIFITLSVLTIIGYATFGYKRGIIMYIIAIIPYLAAIFVNILLPNRNAFQIGLLSILLALTFTFMFKQKDYKVNYIITIAMVIISLTFSIYSSITARLDFLGPMDDAWPTYLAMYVSIFIPTIMSGTFALTYNVRNTRIK